MQQQVQWWYAGQADYSGDTDGTYRRSSVPVDPSIQCGTS
jgi:hypothetical protein